MRNAFSLFPLSYAAPECPGVQRWGRRPPGGWWEKKRRRRVLASSQYYSKKLSVDAFGDVRRAIQRETWMSCASTSWDMAFSWKGIRRRRTFGTLFHRPCVDVAAHDLRRGARPWSGARGGVPWASVGCVVVPPGPHTWSSSLVRHGLYTPACGFHTHDGQPPPEKVAGPPLFSSSSTTTSSTSTATPVPSSSSGLNTLSSVPPSPSSESSRDSDGDPFSITFSSSLGTAGAGAPDDASLISSAAVTSTTSRAEASGQMEEAKTGVQEDRHHRHPPPSVDTTKTPSSVPPLSSSSAASPTTTPFTAILTVRAIFHAEEVETSIAWPLALPIPSSFSSSTCHAGERGTGGATTTPTDPTACSSTSMAAHEEETPASKVAVVVGSTVGPTPPLADHEKAARDDLRFDASGKTGEREAGDGWRPSPLEVGPPPSSPSPSSFPSLYTSVRRSVYATVRNTSVRVGACAVGHEEGVPLLRPRQEGGYTCPSVRVAEAAEEEEEDWNRSASQLLSSGRGGGGRASPDEPRALRRKSQGRRRRYDEEMEEEDAAEEEEDEEEEEMEAGRTERTSHRAHSRHRHAGRPLRSRADAEYAVPRSPWRAGWRTTCSTTTASSTSTCGGRRGGGENERNAARGGGGGDTTGGIPACCGRKAAMQLASSSDAPPPFFCCCTALVYPSCLPTSLFSSSESAGGGGQGPLISASLSTGTPPPLPTNPPHGAGGKDGGLLDEVSFLSFPTVHRTSSSREVQDEILMAFHVAGIEKALIAHFGPEYYHRLFSSGKEESSFSSTAGHSDSGEQERETGATLVNLCASLDPHLIRQAVHATTTAAAASSSSSGTVGGAPSMAQGLSGRWVAKTLLTAKEHHRVQFLLENVHSRRGGRGGRRGGVPSTYAEASSLSTLFILWSLVVNSSVEAIKRERYKKWPLSSSSSSQRRRRRRRGEDEEGLKNGGRRSLSPWEKKRRTEMEGMPGPSQRSTGMHEIDEDLNEEDDEREWGGYEEEEETDLEAWRTRRRRRKRSDLEKRDGARPPLLSTALLNDRKGKGARRTLASSSTGASLAERRADDVLSTTTTLPQRPHRQLEGEDTTAAAAAAAEKEENEEDAAFFLSVEEQQKWELEEAGLVPSIEEVRRAIRLTSRARRRQLAAAHQQERTHASSTSSVSSPAASSTTSTSTTTNTTTYSISHATRTSPRSSRSNGYLRNDDEVGATERSEERERVGNGKRYTTSKPYARSCLPPLPTMTPTYWDRGAGLALHDLAILFRFTQKNPSLFPVFLEASHAMMKRLQEELRMMHVTILEEEEAAQRQGERQGGGRYGGGGGATASGSSSSSWTGKGGGWTSPLTSWFFPFSSAASLPTTIPKTSSSTTTPRERSRGVAGYPSLSSSTSASSSMEGGGCRVTGRRATWVEERYRSLIGVTLLVWCLLQEVEGVRRGEWERLMGWVPWSTSSSSRGSRGEGKKNSVWKEDDSGEKEKYRHDDRNGWEGGGEATRRERDTGVAAPFSFSSLGSRRLPETSGEDGAAGWAPWSLEGSSSFFSSFAKASERGTGFPLPLSFLCGVLSEWLALARTTDHPLVPGVPPPPLSGKAEAGWDCITDVTGAPKPASSSSEKDGTPLGFVFTIHSPPSLEGFLPATQGLTYREMDGCVWSVCLLRYVVACMRHTFLEILGYMYLSASTPLGSSSSSSSTSTAERMGMTGGMSFPTVVPLPRMPAGLGGPSMRRRTSTMGTTTGGGGQGGSFSPSLSSPSVGVGRGGVVPSDGSAPTSPWLLLASSPSSSSSSSTAPGTSSFSPFSLEPSEWSAEAQRLLVLWLLQESPLSPQSVLFFKGLAENQPGVAMEVLRSSGFLSVRDAVAIRRVGSVLIPLLSVATTPEFGMSVLNELVNQLEWRMQQCTSVAPPSSSSSPPAPPTLSMTTTAAGLSSSGSSSPTGGKGIGEIAGGAPSSGYTNHASREGENGSSTASSALHGTQQVWNTASESWSEATSSSDFSSGSYANRFPCFTEEEFDGLAALGTGLMTMGSRPWRVVPSLTGGQGETNNRGACGPGVAHPFGVGTTSPSPPQLSFESFSSRLQEIEVMDGSPVALLKAIYQWGRHVVKADIGGFLLAGMRKGEEGHAEREADGAPPSLQATKHSASSLSWRRGEKKVEPRSSTSGETFFSSSSSSSSAAVSSPPPPPSSSFSLSLAVLQMEGHLRWTISDALRQRFLRFLEGVVQSCVQAEQPVRSNGLNEFVHLHIPVPNIQDEYRRKLYFLVNVTEHTTKGSERGSTPGDPSARSTSTSTTSTTSPSSSFHAETSSSSWWNSLLVVKIRTGVTFASSAVLSFVQPLLPTRVTEWFIKAPSTNIKEGGGEEGRAGQQEEPIPQELRLLVSSLPHTLSPYASVAILRDVLSKSSGRNPRYTYVCRAALDLQLPISTTRSRVATAMNMWSFLRTQSSKLPYRQWLLMQKRCLTNLPLSYILSSYWVVISWSGVLLLLSLHIFGMDYESQVLATSCEGDFGLPEEFMIVGKGEEAMEQQSVEEPPHEKKVRKKGELEQAGDDEGNTMTKKEMEDDDGDEDETETRETREEVGVEETRGEGESLTRGTSLVSSPMSHLPFRSPDFTEDSSPERNPSTNRSRRRRPSSSPESTESNRMETLGKRLLWQPAIGLIPLLSSLLGSDRGELKATLYILDPSRSPAGGGAGRTVLPAQASWEERDGKEGFHEDGDGWSSVEESGPGVTPHPTSSLSSYAPYPHTRLGFPTEGEGSYRRAMYLIHYISSALRFPFFVDMEKPLTLELLEARVAERMRRVSANHTWFWLRPVVRYFSLGLRKTEVNLITNTCVRADRRYKRVTFIVYIHDPVPITYAWLAKLREKSCLSRSANVVVVVHPESLRRGGVEEEEIASLKNEWKYEVQYPTWSSSSKGGGAGVPRGRALPPRLTRTSAPPLLSEEEKDQHRSCDVGTASSSSSSPLSLRPTTTTTTGVVGTEAKISTREDGEAHGRSGGGGIPTIVYASSTAAAAAAATPPSTTSMTTATNTTIKEKHHLEGAGSTVSLSSSEKVEESTWDRTGPLEKRNTGTTTNVSTMAASSPLDGHSSSTPPLPLAPCVCSSSTTSTTTTKMMVESTPSCSTPSPTVPTSFLLFSVLKDAMSSATSFLQWPSHGWGGATGSTLLSFPKLVWEGEEEKNHEQEEDEDTSMAFPSLSSASFSLEGVESLGMWKRTRDVEPLAWWWRLVRGWEVGLASRCSTLDSSFTEVKDVTSSSSEDMPAVGGTGTGERGRRKDEPQKPKWPWKRGKSETTTTRRTGAVEEEGEAGGGGQGEGVPSSLSTLMVLRAVWRCSPCRWPSKFGPASFLLSLLSFPFSWLLCFWSMMPYYHAYFYYYYTTTTTAGRTNMASHNALSFGASSGIRGRDAFLTMALSSPWRSAMTIGMPGISFRRDHRS